MCLCLLLPLQGIAAKSGTHAPVRLLKEVRSCIDIASYVHGIEDLDERFEIAARCPRLGRQLQDNAAAAMFDHEAGEDLTLRELWDMEQLLDLALSPPRSVGRLDYDGLGQLLKNTYVATPEPKKSWWDHFIEWLAQFLPETKKEDTQWLFDLLKALAPPEWVAAILLYGMMALIILIAVGVIVNEWRHYERARRRHRQRRAGGDENAPASVSGFLSLESVLKLPPEARGAAILRISIDSLMETGSLPSDKSYTNREYATYLSRLDSDKATTFAGLSAMAETALYGGRQLQDNDIQKMLAAARDIVEKPAPPKPALAA